MMKWRRNGWWSAVAIATLTIVCAAPAQAQDESPVVVLWMSDTPAGVARSGALAVALAPRGARVTPNAAPPGETAAERARTALGAARANGADVALWLEHESDGSLSIRARAATGELTAWAPLPEDATDPRVVALIAASIIDELLSSPTPDPSVDPSISVTIRARAELAVPSGQPEAVETVGANTAANAAPAPSASAQPALRPRRVLSTPSEPEVDTRSRQRRDFYLETGFMSAGIANGALLSVGFYPHHFVRMDLTARLVHVIPSDSFASAYTVSGAFVTDDDDGRFEIGLSAGFAVVTERIPEGLGRPVCIDPCASGTNAVAGFVGGGYAGFSWGSWPDVRIGFRAHLDASLVNGEITPAPLGDLYVQVMP